MVSYAGAWVPFKKVYCIKYYGGRCAKRSEGMLVVEPLGCLPRAFWSKEVDLGRLFHWVDPLVARVGERWDQGAICLSLHGLNLDHGSREMSVRNREGHVCPVWRSPLAWHRRHLQWAFVECLDLVNGWMEGWVQTCRKEWRKRDRVLPTFQSMVPVPSCLLAPVLTFVALHEVLGTSHMTRSILCWFLLFANGNH